MLEFTMKTTKTPKRADSTDKARKDAIAEIQKRIDSPDVATGGDGAAEAAKAAGSPVPPKGAKAGAKGAKKASAKPDVAAKAAKEPKVAKKPDEKKPAKGGAPSPMSGLDAAAKILAESKKPMNCKELVAESFKQKLWRSEGATPEATLSAAIGREIRAKGTESRFKKVGPGKFAASKN